MRVPPRDRRLAAQVLAARIPRGHHALAKLLHDGDPNVQRAALAAVGQKPDPVVAGCNQVAARCDPP